MLSLTITINLDRLYQSCQMAATPKTPNPDDQKREAEEKARQAQKALKQALIRYFEKRLKESDKPKSDSVETGKIDVPPKPPSDSAGGTKRSK